MSLGSVTRVRAVCEGLGGVPSGGCVPKASWRSGFFPSRVAPLPAPFPLRPTLYGHLTPVPFALCRFDIYRKVPKDLTQPTYTGAISE